MVEKIDRPETPPAYQILPAKEAKDDQSRRQEHEEGEEKYQKGEKGGDWDKYRGRSMTVKPIRVPRDRISRVLYKNVLLRSGMGILEAVVVWKDGRTTDSALFLIPRTEEYMKLRLLKRGDVVPEQFWAKGPEIDIGIVQESPSGSWGAKELGREAKEEKKIAGDLASLLSTLGLIDKTTGRFQWLALLAYILGISVLTLIIIFVLR